MRYSVNVATKNMEFRTRSQAIYDDDDDDVEPRYRGNI